MNDNARGKRVALVAAGVQAAAAAAMLWIAAGTGAGSAAVAFYFFLLGVPMWVVLAVVFYCRQLELQEEQELANLADRGEEGGIFDRGRDLSLRPARTRRARVERWIVPGFSLLWGLVFLAGGAAQLAGLIRWPGLLGAFGLTAPDSLGPVRSVGEGLLFTVLAGFCTFLLSRYCTGLAGREVWRPLRAGAGYMLIGALAAAGVAGAFAAAWWGLRTVDVVMMYAIPAVEVLFGVELLLNVLVEVYRPRVPGQEPRLGFDSRLFGLLAEPARVGHSIAETLNYQFGFEVSRTWFYRLLSKAVVPLLIFGIAVVFLMSSFVVVHEGHQAVVLHWGRKDAGRLLAPGLHVKWPWPIDTARHFDVGKVRTLRVGVGGQREPIVVNGRELRLWTQRHGAWQELDFLLAVPHAGEAPGPSPSADTLDEPGAGESQPPPPVHIIKLVVAVHYRIADPYKFGYRFVDAGKLLADAAYREMVRYCASATLDSPVADGRADRPEAIMTFGWRKASAALENRVRRAVGPGGLDLGVDIRSVNLQAVHPPSEAAEAFQAVLAAERRQDQMRYEAEGQANRLLAEAAGDPDFALELALAISRLERLENLAGQAGKPDELARDLHGGIQHTIANLRTVLRDIRREGLGGMLGAGTDPNGAPTAGAALAERLHRRIERLPPALARRVVDLLDDGAVARLDPSAGTARQRLAVLYVRHLLELLAIRADREGFDFDAAVAGARLAADRLFTRAAGQAARQMARANAYRLQREMAERALAEPFRRELLAWEASPSMYVLDRWLDVWDEVLPKTTKYVLAVSPERVEVRMNWQRRRAVLEGAFGGEGDGSP